MAGNKIGAIIALDGEKEFRQSVSNTRNSLKMLNSEMKLSEEQFKGQANSLEALTSKNDILRRTLEKQHEKVEELGKGLKNANKTYDQIGDGLKTLQEQYEKASQKMEEMKSSGSATEEELKKQQDTLNDLRKAIDQGNQNLQTAQNRIQNWTTQLNNAKTEEVKLNRELEENEKYLDEARQSTDKCAKSIDEYGKEVKDSTSKTKDIADEIEDLGDQVEDTADVMEDGADSASVFGEMLAASLAADAIESGLDTIKDSISSVADSVLEYDAAAQQLQASTGASAEEMEKYRSVLETINGDTFGDGFEDIADVLSTTIQSMGDLDEVELTNISENAIALRDVFKYDYQDTINAVMELMGDFGISSEEAFSLIAQGAQTGIDKNGNMLDVITEFGPKFADMGFSAQDMFNGLANGVDAGISDVNLLGDAMNEFSIKVKDGSADNAFEDLGLDADEMKRKFGEGGEAAQEAFQTVVGALNNVEDPLERNRLGVELFGTMWEDTGGKAILALQNTEGQIDATKDAMGELKDVKYSDLGSQISDLGAQIQTQLRERMEDLLPVAKNGLEFIAENFDLVETAVVGLGTTILANAFFNSGIYSKISGAIGTITTGITGAGGLKAALSTLVSSNPFFAIALALGGVAAAIKLIADNIVLPVDKTQEAIEKADELTKKSDELLEDIEGSTEIWENNSQAIEDNKEYANGLVTELANLADNTERSVAENARMKQLVNDLNTLYPDLALSIDEQTGALKLNGKEYENIEEAIRNVINASTDYQQVQENQRRINEIIEQRSALEEQLAANQKERAELAKQVAEEEEDWAEAAEGTGDQIANGYDIAGQTLLQYNGSLSESKSSLEDLDASTEELTVAFNELGEEQKRLEEENEALTQSTKEVEEQMDSTGEGAENMAETVAQAAEEVRLSAEVSAKAQQESLQSLEDKYEEMRSSIENDLKNKINPYEIFEVEPEDDPFTTEKMTATFQENARVLEEYQSNLEKVKQSLNEGLISEEFYQHLLDLGVEGAAQIRHIAATYDMNDFEGVREASDSFMEFQSVVQETSDMIASEKSVWSDFLDTIGSSPEEFDALQESFEEAMTALSEAGTPASETVKTAFQEMLSAARESGIAIPEGLAEGLASGEISIEDAAATLQGAMRGTFDFLSEMAAEQGIEIPEELAAAIEAGGPEMANAINTLVDRISEGSVYSKLRKAMTNAAKAVGDSSGEFSKEAQEAFSALIDVAEKYGIRMDESLISGISSGATSLADATGIIQESVTAGLDSLIEEAEALGVKFPEGLRAGVKEGTGYTEEAMALIDESIRSKADELTAKMKELGIEIPAELQAGINAGGDAAVEAIEGLNSLIEEEQNKATETSKKVGQESGDAQAEGIGEKEGTVAKAGKSIADSGVTGAASTRGAWQSEGSTLGQMLASGISNAGASVRVAGGSAAQAGADGARGQYNSYYSAGKLLTDGLAAGIRSGMYLAINAAEEVARRALNTAKTILASGENSAKSLGQNTIEAITEGIEEANGKVNVALRKAQTAILQGSFTRNAIAQMNSNFGVSQLNADGAKKDVEQYYKEIYTAAAKWLSDYKKQNGLTLTEETKFWTLMTNEVKKGTQAYYQVQANLSSARFRKDIANPLSNNFGVERTKEDGTIKPAEDYYDDLISAAKNWLENYKITHDVSLQYEEYYWTQIQKKVAKGSDAWYDAQKKITDLQKEKQKELLSASQTALDQYKTYYKVSEYAEVQYWHIIRQQFQEGTEERIEADQKYFEAKQAYNEKLIELNEEYVKNSDEIKEKLKEQTQELKETYENTVNDRAQSIYDSFGLFDDFYSESDSGAVLLNNLKNQVAGYADWELQLEELKKKGVTEGLLEELQEMGPQASASLHALNSLTEEQLQEYQDLWQKKHDLAMAQSKKENEGLRKETEEKIEKMVEEAKQEITKLREEYLKAIAEVQEKIEQPLKNIAINTKKIGEDVTAQLIAGIKSGATKNETSVELKKSVGSVTEALENIPEQTKLIGEDALKELLNGLTDEEKIKIQAKKMIDQLSESIKKAAQDSEILRDGLKIYDDQQNDNLSKEIFAVHSSFDTASAVASVNNITAQGVSETSVVSKKEFSALISEIGRLLETYLPEIAEQKQIILDSGELVGATIGNISSNLAASTRRRR